MTELITLSAAITDAAAAVLFANGNDVTNFFERVTSQDFIDWFNSACAGKRAWADKKLGSTDQVRSRFKDIWNCIPLFFGQPSANLLQFSALMSILIIEVGEELLPVTELVGLPGYPGLAYPFSYIPGVKRSYNTAGLNKLAGDLFFGDENFWSAHNALASASLVRSMPGLRDTWNRTRYPVNLFPTSLDINQSGFIQQADFFKFRGRGFIQTTWRTNYRAIVEFVQNYTVDNRVIVQYREAWSGKDPDVVCSITSNLDWDALFQNTNLIVPSRAVGLHNRASGNYLALGRDPATLSALEPLEGSFYRMGLRINGGQVYARLFTERVLQLLNTLAYTG